MNEFELDREATQRTESVLAEQFGALLGADFAAEQYYDLLVSEGLGVVAARRASQHLYETAAAAIVATALR